jgi:proteasome lid subunit RPN8/RPN11
MARTEIEVPSDVWAVMLEHVQRCLPEEGCGLLGGRGLRARLALPIENALHSRSRFRMAAQAQLDGMLKLETLGLELTAIWHSHPGGPPGPSATDLADAAYPEAAYLIWSPKPDWSCHGFDLSRSTPQPIAVLRLGPSDGAVRSG